MKKEYKVITWKGEEVKSLGKKQLIEVINDLAYLLRESNEKLEKATLLHERIEQEIFWWGK